MKAVASDTGAMVDDIAAGIAEVSSYEARKDARRSSVVERVEVRVHPERRRHWTVEDKLRIVRETLAPGAVAKVVAERHGISTGLLFTWRKQMLATAMAGFMPVDVAPAPRGIEAPAVDSTACGER